MRRRTLAAFVAAALLGTGAWAQNTADSQPSHDSHGPGGPAAGSAGAPPASGMRGMHRSHMEIFTPQEREQFREKMRAATTPEARAQVRNEYHQLAEQRAKEKGISLPPAAERHHGSRAGRQGDRPAALLSPEERTQMREKLRAAQTSEQRAELRKEYRALLEQRAKEKGIDLHEHGRGHRQRERHGPRASA